MPPRSPAPQLAVAAAALMLAVSCTSSGVDLTAVATDPVVETAQAEPVATTAPLSLPDDEAPTEAATLVGPTATSAPQVAQPQDAPTVTAETPGVPLEASPTPLPAATAAVLPDPTAAPDPTATEVVAPTSTAVPEPTAAPAAARIDLVDFPVVDLLTGDTVSLASFSPTGKTLLWFWAPH